MSRLLLAFLLFLVASPGFAQVPADLADDYLETTRLPSQVEEIGGQILQQIQGQAMQFPEPAQGPFRKIYADAFNDDALEDRLENYVTAEGDADSLRAVLAWHEQPLVARMQELEQTASEDDNAQVAVQMYAMSGTLGSHSVTPEREAQIGRYLAATDAAAAAVDLYLDIIVASANSTAALTEESERTPPDTIRAHMRPQLEPMIGGMVRGGSLYAYRDVSDEDLDAYIQQLETPAAQYAVDLNVEAMKAALVGAISDAGAEFVQTLQRLDAEGAIDLDAMRAEAKAKAEQRQMQGSQQMEDDQQTDDMDEDDG